MAANPEVKIRLSLDGAGQVQAGADSASASLGKLEDRMAEISGSAKLSADSLGRIENLLQGLSQSAAATNAALQTVSQGVRQVETAAGSAAGAVKQVSQATTSLSTAAAPVKGVADQLSATAKAADTAGISIGSVGKNAAAGLQSLGNAGSKAGQQMALTGNQTAQLSAQLQDFFVQVQAGGSPMTALIQQGSQLSAVFGGLGNASRAVLSLLTPTVVGVGSVATAVVAIGAAYYKGSEEARQFNRTLILTGNAAGTTSDELAMMAARMDKVGEGITQSRAAEVLNQITASAVVGAKNLERFTTAAIQFERAGGAGADATAKAFAELGRAPVEASLRLNEAQRYLTRSAYEQIKALTEQGKATDAARVAQEAYASALEQRTGALEGNLGSLERGWRSIKTVAAEAWDAMLGIGRSSTPEQVADKLRKELSDIEKRLASGGFSETGGGAATGRGMGAAERQQNEARAAAIREMLRLEERATTSARESAAAKADEGRATQALADLEKESDKYLSRREQMQQAIARATQLAADASKGLAEGDAQRLSIQQDLAKTIAGIQQQYDSGANVEQIRQTERLREEELKRGINSINALRDQGYIRETTAIEERTRLEIAGIDNRKAALVSELAIVSKRQNSERDVAALRGQIAALDAERETARLKGAQAVTTAIEKQKKAIEALYDAQRQQTAEEVDQAYFADSKAREAARLATDDYTRSLRDESTLLHEEARLLGVTRGERELALANLRIQLDLEKRIDELKKNRAFDPSQRADEEQRLRDAADLAKANAAARAQLTEMGDVIQSIDSTAQRVWADVANSGQDAFKRVGNTIKSAVLDLLYQLTIKKWVISVAASVVGGALPAAASAVGSAASAGNAGSLLGIGSLFGAGGLGGSLAAGAGWLTGSTSLMGALSAAGSLIGTGTSAGILSGLGMAAGALGPIAAGVAVLASLDHKRTPHSGASILTDSLGSSVNDQGAFFGATSGAYRWDMSSEVETALKGVNASIVSSLNGISKAFGAGGSYSVGSAFASDNDDASWGTLKLMREGQMVGGFIDQRNFDSSPSKGFEQYSAQASVSVKAAIEAMDLPGWADAMLAKLGESPDFDKLSAGVDQIIKTKAALENLGQVFPPLRGLADTAVSGLLDAFGGVDKLAASASDYYQQFYSDAERKALTTQQLTESLGKLGLALPATREQYRALVDAQDLNTEAGRKAYSVLLQVAPAFASITDAAGDMVGGLDEAARAMVEAGQRALESLAGDYAKLQVDLLRARGDTAGADQLAAQQVLDALLKGVSASDAATIRAQYERNQAIQQEIDQLTAAAAAEKSRAAERERIQAQIDQMLENTAALRERELAALDPANRAMQEYLYRLQAQAAAAQQATQAIAQFQSAMSSLASQRFDAENQILALQGNDAEVLRRTRERDIAEATKNMTAEQAGKYAAEHDAVQALKAQAAELAKAQQAIAQFQSAMSSLASQRFDAENQILALQGNDAEVLRRTRERDIAEATKNMTAEQAGKYAAEHDAVQALKAQAAELAKAQQAAEQAAREQAQSAAEAARAAEQLKSAWQNVADSIYGEAARLRGLSGAETPASLAAAQARFAITTAQARAGDQEAAKLLPELSRTLESMASAQATSLAEIERVRAANAASLEQTGALLSQRFGLTIPKLATGTNYVPSDMLALLHEGEAVTPKAYNPAAGASDETTAELRQLRAQVNTLAALLARTAGATEKTRDLLHTATEGGRAMQTEAYS